MNQNDTATPTRNGPEIDTDTPLIDSAKNALDCSGQNDNRSTKVRAHSRSGERDQTKPFAYDKQAQGRTERSQTRPKVDHGPARGPAIASALALAGIDRSAFPRAPQTPQKKQHNAPKKQSGWQKEGFKFGDKGKTGGFKAGTGKPQHRPAARGR